MKCTTPYCSRKTVRGCKYCPRCSTRRWRGANPIRAAFLNLKHNAIRRGKVFDLSFEEFFELFVGISGLQSFHIDRKDESKGYTIDNLQVLTNAQNVKKYLQYSYNEHGKPVNYTTTVYKPQPEVAGVPF